MDLAFGLTMMVMGMGVTLITLFLLTIVIRIMCHLFPAEPKPKVVSGTEPVAE